jgi:hypothetical protein
MTHYIPIYAKFVGVREKAACGGCSLLIPDGRRTLYACLTMGYSSERCVSIHRRASSHGSYPAWISSCSRAWRMSVTTLTGRHVASVTSG